MQTHAQLVPESVSAAATPFKRTGVAVGRRFFLLIAIGLVWLGPAFGEPKFLWAMLAWDVLVIAAWTVDLARLPRPKQLEVRRTWRDPAALSVASTVELMVINRGTAQISAELTDNVPTQLRREAPRVTLTVTPRSDASAVYEIQPAARGEVRTGSVYVRYQSALHIAERWAAADLAQTVRIYPNLDEARQHAIYLVRSRQIELEKRYAHVRGAGREFESLREYRQGDEYRDICWTASARRGKLVTRQYQVERSQTIWLAIDCGRLMRARLRGLSKLDHAVNAALSLAEVALYSGDRVGLLAYGRGVRQRVLPGRGSAHLRQVMEQLVSVHEEVDEADHLGAASALLTSQKRRSLVVWLTDLAETAMTPEVIEAASRMMPPHLVLFVVIGQPDLAEMAGIVPQNSEEMFRSTAAQEVIHRRELLMARLRERGALTVEATGAVSTLVINEYLRIKEKSLL